MRDIPVNATLAPIMRAVRGWEALEARMRRLTKKHPNRNTVAIKNTIRWYIQAAMVHGAGVNVSPVATMLNPNVSTGELLFRASKLEVTQLSAVNAADKVDQASALLKETVEEMKSAKEELEQLKNQVTNLYATTLPELEEHLLRFRGVRMAVGQEMTLALTCLRDVRRFFMEREHTEEIQRLERFAALCRELLELKKSGALDAICDSALKLEMGGKE